MSKSKISYLLAFLVFLFLLFHITNDVALARAGGGGSSSGGGGIATLVIAGIYLAIMKIRRAKMLSKAKKNLEIALASDSSWNEKLLKQAVEDVFYRYQDARSNKNLSSLREYLTSVYYEEANKLLLELNGNKNIIKNAKLGELNVISIKDGPGQDGDMFVMEVNASMIDYVINETSGEFVSSTMHRKENESNSNYQSRAMSEAGNFREYWVFMRVGQYWLLHDIKQNDSIIKDIMGMSESQLKEILAKEETTEEVNDGVFYEK